MLRKFLVLLIIAFTPYYLLAQSKQYLEIQDSIQYYFNIRNQKGVKQYIRSQQNSNQNISNLLNLSIAKHYMLAKKHDSTQITLNNILVSNPKDSLHFYFIARQKELLGHYYYKINEIENSIENLNTSAEHYIESKNLNSAIYNNIMIGVIYRKKHEYLKALNYYYKALSYYPNSKLDSSNYYTAKIDVAIIYNHLNKYDKSLKILKTLIENKSFLSTKNRANVFNNLAISYSAFNKDTLAYNYLLKAEILYLELNNLSKLSIVYNNLATLQYDLFNNNIKSLKYYNKSIAIKTRLGDKRGLAESYLNMSKVYNANQNYNRSKLYSEKSLALAEEIKNNKLIRDAHFTLSMVNEQLGNYKEAYFHHVTYKKLEYEIWNEKKERQLQELEENIEIKKIQSNLKLAEKEKEVSILLADKSKKKTILIAVFSLIILIYLAIYIIYTKQKEKINTTLYNKNLDIISVSSLVQGQEEERKRIAQDLHDGVGNSLTLLMISLQKNNNTEMLKLAQSISQDVRAISYNLMPNGLTKFGLQKSIRELCNSWSKDQTIVDLNFNISTTYFQDNTSILTIYRIIQEIINNAITKGKATYISILFKDNNDVIYIITEDNGKGIDPEDENRGQGLNNIENRVKYMKGYLELKTSKQGTSYTIEIPKK